MGTSFIAKGDIRYAWLSECIYWSMLRASCSRLARRGGIKRISGTIYDDARQAMIDRIKAVCLLLSNSGVLWTNLSC